MVSRVSLSVSVQNCRQAGVGNFWYEISICSNTLKQWIIPSFFMHFFIVAITILTDLSLNVTLCTHDVLLSGSDDVLMYLAGRLM